MAEPSMLESSVLGMPYARVILERADAGTLVGLRAGHDFVHVVSHATPATVEGWQWDHKSDAVIELGEGVEAAVSRFSATCRNQVRKASRLPGLVLHPEVTVDEGFYHFHREAEHARGWRPVPREELAASVVAGATLDGEWIAGISCYGLPGHLRVGRIFSLRRTGVNRGVVYSAATRALVTELCRAAAGRGLARFSLAGIDDDGGPAKAGIAEFKRGFGPRVVPTWVGRWSSPRFRARQAELAALGVDVG